MRFFDFRLMGCLIFSFGAFAQGVEFPDVPEIREVDLLIEHVFVPKGFDSNDTSEIIVSGWYPNPCYEWSRATVSKYPGELDVRLKALVKKGVDTVCIDMAVPFLESIKLGTLHEGRIKLQVSNQKSDIEIAKASTNSIDDHIYGRVKYVRSEGKTLFLEIEQPSTCIQMDRIEAVFNGTNTCAILPIMKKVSEVCPRNPQVFEYRFDIPEEYLIEENVLFHVRSLEGKAVNYLFKNR